MFKKRGCKEGDVNDIKDIKEKLVKEELKWSMEKKSIWKDIEEKLVEDDYMTEN